MRTARTLSLVALVLSCCFTTYVAGAYVYYVHLQSDNTTAVGVVLAQAQDDPRTGLDCEDYGSQAEAQAALRQEPNDPNVLDEDNDGIACETYPYDDPATDEIQVPGEQQQPGAQQRPQDNPQPDRQRRERMPESGGLPGGALPVKPDGSCPAKFPVKHYNICLAR
jgi:hypothetical protein